ncbi:MAG TPA: phosphoadenosine phosphosulfate reductase family protein [Clostridiaceae bacterium]|nr:phosphoadenosine phosphosulfate reductase family protein [Clostridiaceae bacterium]
MSQQRIRQWYEHWNGDVYVSFSGGKDSTVLLHIVRSIYPEVPAVFVDTGLEYPEIRQFVKTAENVTWLRPEMSFKQVIEKYGYPVISKRQAQYIRQAKHTKSDILRKLRITGIRRNGRFSSYSKISDKWQYLINAPFKVSEQCCNIMKIRPMDKYFKENGRYPYVGTMASDGANRELEYLQTGCNSFEANRPKSMPLGFWTEEDIWEYIRVKDVSYSRIYDMGYRRTGCIFCMFGAHLEDSPNRFQRMKHTHPQLWKYCMFNLGLADVLDYVGVDWGAQMEIDDLIC